MIVFDKEDVIFVLDFAAQDSNSDSIKSARVKKVFSSNNQSRKIIIPSELNVGGLIIPVNTILMGAFQELSCGELIIPDSITELEPCAMVGLRAKKVVISRNIKMIPNKCFAYSSIKEIIFLNPENVLAIQEEAFSHISRLKEFTWPSNCILIPDKCFVSSSILKVNGIENVEFIGESAFQNSKISEFIWPENCSEVSKSCFSGSKLEKISGTEYIKHIHTFAFEKTKLNSIDLPAVEKIEENAFRYTAKLLSVQLGGHTDKELVLSSKAFSSKLNIDVSQYPSVSIKYKKGQNISNIHSGFDTELKLYELTSSEYK